MQASSARGGILPDGFQPVTECVEDPVTFSLDWFIHPSAAQFTICSYCYVQHIQSTPFRDSFSLKHLVAGKHRRCLFGTPRVKYHLWPQALASRSLDALVTYMQACAKIPHCAERVAQAGQSWYIPADNPDSMWFCQACYEDKVRMGPIGAMFRLEVRSEAGLCDHATWFIRRRLAEVQNWGALVREAADRLRVLACPGTQLVTGPERLWFSSSQGPAGFQVCEGCYWDYFHRSPDEPGFQARRLGQGEDAVCLMSQANFLIPMLRALSLNNRNIFWQAAHGISGNALCNPKGTTGARWYTLPSNPPEFDVCGACMAGIVRPMGVEHHFIPKPSAGPNDTLLCCFNVQGFWRAGVFLEKLVEGAYRRTWQPLGQLAADLAHSPICPKIDREKAARNQRWWGWSDAHISEECYSIAARGTRLEVHFELKGHNVGEPRICDFFSARVRAHYHDACEEEEGSPSRFLEFARARRRVYLETMPECDRLLASAKFALGQAQTLGLAAVTFSAAGHLKDTTWGHDYTVGNSVVGHGYANEELMNAAMADHQMQMTGAAATGPAAVARVGALEKRWKMVE